jgi:hypothetical protein
MTKYKRDNERFWTHTEREAQALLDDPEYFKPKVRSERLSRATIERLRVLKRDINRDPLRRGQRVSSVDQLINRLVDEHNGRVTSGPPALIAVQTRVENGENLQTADIEGVF